jgi:hypothetical protein
MTDRIARLRVRSVRMKNGGASIRLLRADNRDYHANIRKRVDLCLQNYNEDIGGFAFVVWDTKNDSCADGANYRSTIPTILIPDFVRNRLLAERIVDWAIEEVEKNK